MIFGGSLNKLSNSKNIHILRFGTFSSCFSVYPSLHLAHRHGASVYATFDNAQLCLHTILGNRPYLEVLEDFAGFFGDSALTNVRFYDWIMTLPLLALQTPNHFHIPKLSTSSIAFHASAEFVYSFRMGWQIFSYISHPSLRRLSWFASLVRYTFLRNWSIFRLSS